MYQKPTVIRLGVFRELTKAGPGLQQFDAATFVGHDDGLNTEQRS